MLVLDGSEGGGQILRTALGLSVVTQKPFTLTNVRSSRPNPGLQTQHLEALNAVARLCNADVEGSNLGSKEIIFKPGHIQEQKLTVEIGTAGSVGLVFQALQLVPYVLKKPLEVHVRGGATYGKWAPPVDYLTNVFLPVMQKFGYRASISVEKHGFYPTGGADVTFVLEPWKSKGSILLAQRGELQRTRILSLAAEDLKKGEVVERQTKSAKHTLNVADLKATTETTYTKADNPGSGIVCFNEYKHTVLGGDCIGEKGLRAEEVGKTAAQNLLNAIAASCTLDKHASDMILPFMALADGGEIVAEEITNHIRTNIAVIEAFLPVKFKIDEKRITMSSH